MSSGAVLEVSGVLRTFGGIRAVDDLTFRVEAGETLGIIGPNGAGKSVLLDVINGVYPTESGSIRIDGARIDQLRPHQVAAQGVARAFQSTDKFREFRVVDFVLLGRLRHQRASVVANALTLPAVRRTERSERAVAMAALERFGLAGLAEERLSELPYGAQKLVDIARAVAAQPRLLLLDEPTSGTTSTERGVISTVLEDVAAGDVTMVIVDHDVSFIASISDRLLVMNYGKLLAQGEPDEVLRRADVTEAYLGL